MFAHDRSGSCYPHGLGASRRAFLKSLATAAAASSIALPSATFAQDGIPADEPIPAFPPGGFGKGAIRLNFNENPLGPSKRALEAIVESGLVEGNRYNYIDPLIEAIANHHKVPSKQVLVGCGSTEFLQFAPWALLNDGGSIVLPTPSYGWAGGVAQTMGREAIRVPLGEMGTVDVAGLRKALRADTRILYIANPNNPTGAPVSSKDVRALAEALPPGGVLIVDEAYHDFLPDADSSFQLVRDGAPVLVLRTFSKAYGMAGLRLGYAIGPDEVLDRVKKTWWGDFGINSAAHIAGPVALADQEHVRQYVRTIDAGLVQLRSGLEAMGFNPFSHRAPFFMANLGRTARPLVRALYEKQVFVQDGANWDMPEFIRVSVGTEQDNDIFLKAMREAVRKAA